MAEGNDKPAELVHRVEVADLARFAAVAAGALYAFGVLVVNADLATYGVTFMGFGRVEYLFAGGAAVVILGTPLVVAYTAYNLTTARKTLAAALSGVDVAEVSAAVLTHMVADGPLRALSLLLGGVPRVQWRLCRRGL
jgi:hypothetical protein